MKPVSVVEVYTTKFVCSFSIEKMYCNESTGFVSNFFTSVSFCFCTLVFSLQLIVSCLLQTTVPERLSSQFNKI